MRQGESFASEELLYSQKYATMEYFGDRKDMSVTAIKLISFNKSSANRLLCSSHHYIMKMKKIIHEHSTRIKKSLLGRSCMAIYRVRQIHASKTERWCLVPLQASALASWTEFLIIRNIIEKERLHEQRLPSVCADVFTRDVRSSPTGQQNHSTHQLLRLAHPSHRMTMIPLGFVPI